jgi:hypothetical protein
MNPSIKLNFAVIGFNAALFLLLIEKFNSNLLTFCAAIFMLVSTFYCMKSVAGFTDAIQKNKRGVNRIDPKPLFEKAGRFYAKGAAFMAAGAFCIFLAWLIYGTNSTLNNKTEPEKQTSSTTSAEKKALDEEQNIQSTYLFKPGAVLTHTHCMGCVEEHVFIGWSGAGLRGFPPRQAVGLSSICENRRS